ncbi:MAG: hypothetical protein N2111_02845 [Candidatus Sumerlaeaceae bacterium]|nr:hypothetical protein [Candidatus Sumerlaeaceae bacterium]
MVKIELTAEEQAALIETLEQAIPDLRSEIVKTESHPFREQLKHRKEILIKVLEDLKQAQAAV